MTGAPLSFNQEFLLAFDKGDADGAFGERHILVDAWRLTGPVEATVLQQALNDVVARHDVLRTDVVAGEGGGHQVVHPPNQADLSVRMLDSGDRDRDAEALLNDVDEQPINVAEIPHLRAVLGQFDEKDSVLVLATHHVASDDWSMGLLVRDLAACYTARLAGKQADLPEAPQYAEFAVWQRHGGIATGQARDYWRHKLHGNGMTAVPTDRPLPDDRHDVYAAHRFVLDDDLSAKVGAFARSVRSTPFMVLLAAHQLQLRDMTGVSRIMTPTFTAGRYQERFNNTVGPFFNLLPLLTDLGDARHLRDAVTRVRTTCFEAYAHDIPFGDIVDEVPQITEAFGDPGGAVVAFQVLQPPAFSDDLVLGEATGTAIRDRRLSQRRSSSIPNGGSWALEILRSGRIVSSLKYNANTFDGSTITGIADDFRRRLEAALT
ncbi:condensation domain-containing protein [Amycolatopsis cihanbeyliensis]|uniref:Condensation domain-containing protein n=1 Tax=Amycolatopsis cihanbeyliensis TaxID=1128664 RepID=A0A542DQK7_AMYCI|nr:condensation domain-containing protein [Amycolatopsis cihanbeyliensis]TQJ05245.1 condensation domain-containing protein [Amycolatopsis cihanbeyliensis]